MSVYTIGMTNNFLHTTRRLALVLAGAALAALNIITLVRGGGLIPGGFTGLVLLIQEICSQYGGFHIPFSVVLYTLNAIPVVICFKFVGKKFTLYSVLVVVVCGLLTDVLPLLMPDGMINYFSLQDPLLSAVFGGFISAFAKSLCLYAGATGGGTDLIAIFISEKYRKDSWHYIFAGNFVILVFAGIFFSLDKVLYSIIFQYTTTTALGVLYRNYQQRTLLIISSKPDEIYGLINEMTRHGATYFDGHGAYEKEERVMLYSVVTASQEKDLIPAIMKIDPGAFINVLKTEQLDGKFYIPPKD
ncbi:MAG: YitT family protein [Synergistaceae bacterium]|nr:YitT family protein [Synergistaceae bacterium]